MDEALLPFIALVSIRKHITVRAPLAAPCLYYIDENNTNISQETVRDVYYSAHSLQLLVCNKFVLFFELL